MASALVGVTVEQNLLVQPLPEEKNKEGNAKKVVKKLDVNVERTEIVVETDPISGKKQICALEDKLCSRLFQEVGPNYPQTFQDFGRFYKIFKHDATKDTKGIVCRECSDKPFQGIIRRDIQGVSKPWIMMDGAKHMIHAMESHSQMFRQKDGLAKMIEVWTKIVNKMEKIDVSRVYALKQKAEKLHAQKTNPRLPSPPPPIPPAMLVARLSSPLPPIPPSLMMEARLPSPLPPIPPSLMTEPPLSLPRPISQRPIPGDSFSFPQRQSFNLPPSPFPTFVSPQYQTSSAFHPLQQQQRGQTSPFPPVLSSNSDPDHVPSGHFSGSTSSSIIPQYAPHNDNYDFLDEIHGNVFDNDPFSLPPLRPLSPSFLPRQHSEPYQPYSHRPTVSFQSLSQQNNYSDQQQFYQPYQGPPLLQQTLVQPFPEASSSSSFPMSSSSSSFPMSSSSSSFPMSSSSSSSSSSFPMSSSSSSSSSSFPMSSSSSSSSNTQGMQIPPPEGKVVQDRPLALLSYSQSSSSSAASASTPSLKPLVPIQDKQETKLISSSSSVTTPALIMLRVSSKQSIEADIRSKQPQEVGAPGENEKQADETQPLKQKKPTEKPNPEEGDKKDSPKKDKLETKKRKRTEGEEQKEKKTEKKKSPKKKKKTASEPETKEAVKEGDKVEEKRKKRKRSSDEEEDQEDQEEVLEKKVVTSKSATEPKSKAKKQKKLQDDRNSSYSQTLWGKEKWGVMRSVKTHIDEPITKRGPKCKRTKPENKSYDANHDKDTCSICIASKNELAKKCGICKAKKFGTEKELYPLIDIPDGICHECIRDKLPSCAFEGCEKKINFVSSEGGHCIGCTIMAHPHDTTSEHSYWVCGHFQHQLRFRCDQCPERRFYHRRPIGTKADGSVEYGYYCPSVICKEKADSMGEGTKSSK